MAKKQAEDQTTNEIIEILKQGEAKDRVSVPRDVISLLALVRTDGGANMIADKKGVMRIAKRIASDQEKYGDAFRWLKENPDRYGAALFSMGDMRAAGLVK